MAKDFSTADYTDTADGEEKIEQIPIFVFTISVIRVIRGFMTAFGGAGKKANRYA
jgi:hypothetical protein